MRPEQQFWTYVREHLPGHVQRVENTLERGTPDVNLCYQGKHFWIELKVEDKGKVELRGEQYAWMLRRNKAGGNCFVLVYYPVTRHVACWKFPMTLESLVIIGKPDRLVPKNPVGMNDIIQFMLEQ